MLAEQIPAPWRNEPELGDRRGHLNAGMSMDSYEVKAVTETGPPV
jgi:hypothetical protein